MLIRMPMSLIRMTPTPNGTINTKVAQTQRIQVVVNLTSLELRHSLVQGDSKVSGSGSGDKSDPDEESGPSEAGRSSGVFGDSMGLELHRCLH